MNSISLLNNLLLLILFVPAPLPKVPEQITTKVLVKRIWIEDPDSGFPFFLQFHQDGHCRIWYIEVRESMKRTIHGTYTITDNKLTVTHLWEEYSDIDSGAIQSLYPLTPEVVTYHIEQIRSNSLVARKEYHRNWGGRIVHLRAEK